MTQEEEENLGFFVSDATEAIRAIEESLLTLEVDPENDHEMNRLYRGMHTLKGNAGFLELTAIETLAHACEDLVSLVRDKEQSLDAEMVNLLLEALDKLRWAMQVLTEEHTPPSPEAVRDLVARIAATFEARGGMHLEKDSPAFELFDDDEVPPAEVAASRRPGGTESPVSLPSRAASARPAASSRPVSSPGPAAGAKATSAAAPTRERIEFLRVDAAKVGSLMDLAGELGLACSAVTRHPDLEGRVLEGFAAAAHRLELLVREIQNDMSSLRLVPVSPVFQRMRRVVRDAAKRTNKEIDFVIRGEDTEVDKVMIDALQDPLIHVLRNAVDHGIEAPEVRVAAGKPRRGRIVLSASHQGGEVKIEVRDDGRGLDRERVLARAKERGLCAADATPSEEEITQFVFLPGFSTKETADALSGRGVGMDVLKTTVEALRGRVGLTSTAGQGSRVAATMPLTLAFVEAMVVRENDRLFALPIEKVFEVSKVDFRNVVESSATRQTMLRVRDTCVPVLWLHTYWDEPQRAPKELDGRVVVLVQTSRGAVAIPVDELIGNQQVMLKPLRGTLSGIRAAAGCGMLRTGDVAIALDCDRLHG
jgi:two-component system chemotaxis sensor kinase CheA